MERSKNNGLIMGIPSSPALFACSTIHGFSISLKYRYLLRILYVVSPKLQTSLDSPVNSCTSHVEGSLGYGFLYP
ncbi:MAG: hypothetical protein QXZ41_08430 [Ignisphaera sp.]